VVRLSTYNWALEGYFCTLYDSESYLTACLLEVTSVVQAVVYTSDHSQNCSTNVDKI